MKPFVAKYALLAAIAAPVHARFLLSGWSKGSKESSTLHELQEKDMSPETRIVGGVLAAEKEFPWYVASSTDSGYLCGGSLIHEQIVLTAAHCADAFAVGQDVFVGALYLNSAQGGAQRRTIAKVLSHPDYDDWLSWNDYMLLKLNAPVKDVDVLQLELSPADPPSTETLTTMGFGTTEEDGDVSLALREVDILPVDFDTCESQYEGLFQLSEEIHLCAGFPGGGKDSCQGDSGGPLITSAGKQIGVVSLGYGCARVGYPGVYARISGAADFIRQGICGLSDNPPSDCQDDPAIEEETPTADIRITVGYDFWVDETSWEITQGSTTIYSGPQYDPVSYEVWDTTLPDMAAGTYTFTIFDSACDGMDSLFGDGFYEVWLIPESGAEQLLASGDHIFDCNDSVSFVVPGGRDTPAIEPATGSGSAEVIVTVGYDYWVSETSWQISQGSEVLYTGPQYDPEPYGVWDTTFATFPSGSYTFTMFDSACDGMVSAFGEGFFEIWLVPESGSNQLLASGDHDFTCSKSVSFTVFSGSRRRQLAFDDQSVSNTEKRSGASPTLRTIASATDLKEVEDAFKHADKTTPRVRSAVVGTDKHDNAKLEEEALHERGKHRNGLATANNFDRNEKINEALYKRYHR